MTWLELINAVIPILVVGSIYAVIRLAVAVAQVQDSCRTLERDLKRLEERARRDSAKESASFQTICGERHHNLDVDIKEIKDSHGQVLRRLERLKTAVAYLGDAVNGKRRKAVTEDTES